MPLRVDGFVFDLDGTIYLGNAALPAASMVLRNCDGRGKKVLFVSNKPLEPRQAYAAKLTRLGIPTSPEDVITSGYVLGHHLAHHEPNLRYYLIGEEALRAELRSHGLTIVDELASQDPKEVIEPAGIDAVIVAFDRTLDYRKLNTAYQALLRGARFYATNGDKACPMPGGSIPDAGGTIAALEHMTGRKLELLAGKPSTLIVQVALERLGVPAARCMMVGDRLETDIFMGQQAGMATGVVLTGVATRADAERMSTPPTFILDNVGAIPALVE